jgi:hypothetical protein
MKNRHGDWRYDYWHEGDRVRADRSGRRDVRRARPDGDSVLQRLPYVRDDEHHRHRHGRPGCGWLEPEPGVPAFGASEAE